MFQLFTILSIICLYISQLSFPLNLSPMQPTCPHPPIPLTIVCLQSPWHRWWIISPASYGQQRPRLVVATAKSAPCERQVLGGFNPGGGDQGQQSGMLCYRVHPDGELVRVYIILHVKNTLVDNGETLLGSNEQAACHLFQARGSLSADIFDNFWHRQRKCLRLNGSELAQWWNLYPKLQQGRREIRMQEAHSRVNFCSAMPLCKPSVLYRQWNSSELSITGLLTNTYPPMPII